MYSSARIAILVILAALPACRSPRAPAALPAMPTVAARPIFRYVKLSGGQLDLGRPLTADERVRFLEPLDDSTYAVRGGVFGSAETVAVRVAPGGAPRQIVFSYAPGGYNPSVAEYTETLGPPRHADRARGEERVVWEDGATRFTLLWRSDASGTRRTYAVMEDLRPH